MSKKTDPRYQERPGRLKRYASGYQYWRVGWLRAQAQPSTFLSRRLTKVKFTFLGAQEVAP